MMNLIWTFRSEQIAGEASMLEPGIPILYFYF